MGNVDFGATVDKLILLIYDDELFDFKKLSNILLIMNIHCGKVKKLFSFTVL